MNRGHTRLNNKIIGKYGEDLAEMLLIKEGYQVITRNYYCCFGEIDIIARKDETMAFIEVKTRLSTKFGSGREAVDLKKEDHIKKSINHFLARSKWTGKIDFQVIEICLTHLTGLQFTEG